MFLMVMGLLPAIPHIVVGVEKLFGKGNGGHKKQAAMSAVSDMLNIFSQASGSAGADSSHTAFLDDLIEATVKFFNANGTFTHQQSGDNH